jgi:hypothetical protein
MDKVDYVNNSIVFVKLSGDLALIVMLRGHHSISDV